MPYHFLSKNIVYYKKNNKQQISSITYRQGFKNELEVYSSYQSDNASQEELAYNHQTSGPFKLIRMACSLRPL